MERSRRRRGALVAGNVLVLASASMLGLAHCGSDDAPLGSAPDAAPESAPTATPTSSSSNDGGAAGDAAKEGAVPVTPVAPLWVQTFGSGGAFEMAVTPDGDVVIAASEHANGGPEDILVVKMTGAGTIVWTKRFGGPGQDQCVSVGVDDTGDVFISGKLGSASVDFGGGVVVDGLTTGEEYGYVARLDGATGTGKWARVFRATSPAYVDLVAVRGGHVAIAGRFAGTLTYAAAGVDGGSAMTADALGTRNAWFASLDPATGLVRWFVRASTTGSGTDAETLAVDENGEVYGTVTFSNAPLQGLGAARPPIGMVDLALFRLADADGSPVWVKQLANAQKLGILAPRHLSFAGTGPLLLAGSLRGDLDLGLGTLSVPTGDRAALFVALDRATGAATWQRLHTFPESSMRGDVMRSAPAGDLLVAASYSDPSSNNPIPVVEVEGRSLPDPEGGQGSYAIRYAADGTAKWTRVVVPIPGAQNNPDVRINDLVALPSGPVIAAGWVFGRADLGSGVPIDGPLGISGITIWAWPP